MSATDRRGAASDSSGRPPAGWTRRLAPVAACAAVVVLALVLRSTFVTGMVHADNLSYAGAAHDFARHGLDVSAGAPTARSRVAMYVPVGVLYRVFGVSDRTSLAWPFVCSLVTVLLIYQVARLLAGEAAGLFAAFVWAVLPLDISLATTLLPDGPLSMFTTASVWLFLLADRARGRRVIALIAGCAVCFAAAVLTKPTGLVIGIFFAAHLARRVTFGWRAAALAAGLIGLAALLFAYQYRYGGTVLSARFVPIAEWMRSDLLVQTATDWYRKLTQGPDFFALLPLFLVAASVTVALRLPGASVALGWLGASFLYLELGTRTPAYYQPWPVEMLRQLAFAIVPGAVLAGIYLGHFVTARAARGIAIVAALGLIGVVWHESRNLPSLPAPLMGTDEAEWPFASISALAAAVAVFGSIASAACIARASAWKRTACAAVVVAGVGLSTLNPTLEAVTLYRTTMVVHSKEAVAFLRTAPDLPWLAQQGRLADWLNYDAGYTRDVKPVPADARQMGSAYVITDTDLLIPRGELGDTIVAGPEYVRNPPPTWWEMKSFSAAKGHVMRIYRVLSGPDAQKELAAAQAAYAAHPGPEAEHRLTGAEINAADSCRAAFSSLHEAALATVNPDVSGIVPALEGCYASHPSNAGPNLLRNGDFAQGLADWGRPTAPNVDVSVEAQGGAPAAHIRDANPNQRAVLLQNVTLKPDTPYVFEMEVKSTQPVVALYWSTDVARYDSERRFPDWTKVTYVFVTPHWNGQPRSSDVHPVLFNVPGDAWLRNVRLSELTPETN